jgi:hypothetical protein
MTDQLFGRVSAVELVRELMQRSVDPTARGERLPIVIFEGMRGSGKTALLNALAGLVDQRVPYAYLNFEAGNQVRVQIPQVMSAIALDLHRRCPLYGRLRFPRLAVGQLVIGTRLDRNNPQASVVAALRQQRRIDTVVAILKDAAGQVAQTMSVPSPVSAGLAGRLLEVLVAGLTAWGPGRRLVLGKYQQWYGHRDQDDTAAPVDTLIQLNRWARSRDEEDQRLATNLQWAALFADLRDDFDRRPVRRMPSGCLLLLDNVDTQLGRTFLTGLIEARRAAALEGLVPLTVVATSRGALLARRSAPELADITVQDPSYRTVLMRLGADARPTWLRYRLPDLTEDEVADLAAGLLRGRGPRHADKLIYGFTGGHPLSTRTLLATLAQQRSSGPGLTDLLDRDVPDDLAITGTVEEWLCRRLLGIGDAVAFPDTTTEYLTTCAAARDADDAVQLLPPAARDGITKRISEVNLWNPVAGHGCEALRRLLLRRLAGRHPIDGPNGWQTVHGRLREDCEQDKDDPGELYHALATGDLPTVTSRLAAWLTEREPWVPLVELVANAPCRQPIDDAALDEMTRDEPTATPTGTDSPDPQRELVHQLVARLWAAADPLAQVDRCDLHTQIANTYRALVGTCSGRGRKTELRNAARRHDTLADQWN